MATVECIQIFNPQPIELVGKYEVVREQLKHKATLTRKAEALCDLRDEWLILLRDEKRAQFVALQSTLGEVSRLWAQQSLVPCNTFLWVTM